MENILNENDICFFNIPKAFRKSLNQLKDNSLLKRICENYNLDDHTKQFLFNLLNYYLDPTKYGNNWTKTRAMEYFGLTRYRIDKIFEELEANGLLVRHKIYPHTYNEEAIKDDELKRIMKTRHSQIYWISEFRLDLGLNKKEIEETTKSNEKNIQLINEQLKKPAPKRPETDVKVMETELASNPFYLMALEKYKSDYISNAEYTIDTSKEIVDFCNDALFDGTEESKICDGDVDGVVNICWDVIVMGQVYDYNTKAFNNFRYSQAGNKMASINTKAIKQAFTKFRTYTQGESNVNWINEYENGNLKFLLQSSVAIHNYIKLHFMENKLPTYSQLLGLYKVLADNPELLCLEYSEEAYKVLDYFFIKNQQLYTKKE